MFWNLSFYIIIFDLLFPEDFISFHCFYDFHFAKCYILQSI